MTHAPSRQSLTTKSKKGTDLQTSVESISVVVQQAKGGSKQLEIGFSATSFQEEVKSAKKGVIASGKSPSLASHKSAILIIVQSHAYSVQGSSQSVTKAQLNPCH